jgi:tripartite ATP-independent transporter DctP family solute receptor
MAAKRSRRWSATRREALKVGLASAAGTGLVGAGLLRAARAETYVFRMAHAEAIGSPITEAFEQWGTILRERSDGRIDAQHFPAGQLGNYTQLIEGSRIGTIQATAGGPDTEEAVAPEIAASGGAPGFIYADEGHVDRVLQGPLGEEISQIARAKTGVEFVAYGEVGFRHLLAKRPVTSLDELSGLKIRVPELKIWVDFWQKLGANPTPLPYAEQYNALSTGVIDGLEADFFSIKGFKWYEQADQLTLTYHWFLPKAIRVNAAWLDGLPPDLRTLVRESAKEVFAAQRAINRTNTSAALEDLQAAAVQVHMLDDAEKQRWLAATEPLFVEFGQKSPETKAMIDQILALR